jgi:hypothetical protein
VVVQQAHAFPLLYTAGMILHLSIVVRSEQLRHHLLMQHLFVDVLTKQW